MPTICFCNTTTAWGGGEKWHLEAALSLAARGWQVFLLCHEQGALYVKAKSFKTVTAIPLRFGRLSFLNPIKTSKLVQFFMTHTVSAVVLNLPSDVKIMGRAAKKAGVPHIIYRRGSALPVRNSLFNRYLYRHVITRLIVNSLATKEAVLANNPDLIPKNRITLLPNGIDVATFENSLAKATPLPAPTKGIVIGNAGRLNHQKGQHYLLHLGATLKEAQVPFTLIIAGAGERDHELKNLATQLGIDDHVIFTGFMDDLSPFWKRIDLFVLTSLWEGFGFVLVEAMLAQKPVLAFAVSNIPELVRHQENGLLFPLPTEKTPENKIPDMRPMADAIAHLAGNPEEQKRMGSAGRAFAVAHFSQCACMNVLEGLLSSAPPPDKQT